MTTSVRSFSAVSVSEPRPRVSGAATGPYTRPDSLLLADEVCKFFGLG
jgi:hypothetical protein